MTISRPFRYEYILAMAVCLVTGLQVAMGVWSSPAYASTYTVTKTTDDNGTCDPGDCSLREAILAANAQPDVDVVILPAGTYTLTLVGSGSALGDLDITQPLTLQGAGAGATVINANGIDRVLDIASADVLVSGLTLYNGSAPGSGGGVRNSGGRLLLEAVEIVSNTASSSGGGIYIASGSELYLANSHVDLNSANGSGGGLNADVAASSWITATAFTRNVSQGGGGAISNKGILSLRQVDVLTNTAQGFPGGGGIRHSAGVMTLTLVTLRSNLAAGSGSGGGLLLEAASATGISVTVGPDNQTTHNGGGVALVTTTASLNLFNSVIFSNTATGNGGGANNEQGRLVLGQTDILSNTANGVLGGGGLNNNLGASTWITASHVSNNQAANAGGDGGGLLNFGGSIDVADSVIGPGNVANDDGGGVVVRAFSSITLTNSLVISNTTPSAIGSGAGLHNDEGVLVLDHTTVEGNIDSGSFGGGGIRTNNGVDGPGMTILRNGSVVRNNQTAAGEGGGIFVFRGQLLVSDSTIEGNIAGRGGGGLALNLFSDSTNTGISAVIVNSAIVSNTASNPSAKGGGIYNNGGTLDIVNTTLSGNQAAQGGGLYTADADVTRTAALTLTHATLAGNTGSAGIQVGSGAATARNSLFADNDTQNCSGTLASAGHNLDSGSTCAFGVTGDITSSLPLLGPLADNGGPSLTRALLAGSPAIYAADLSFCPAADQRGFRRTNDGLCDIGAYERIAVDLAVSVTDGVEQVVPGQALTYTLVVDSAGVHDIDPVRVTDALPGALLGPLWACAASPGSSCHSTQGAGPLDITAALAPGGRLTVTITGTVALTVSTWLTNVASVSAPLGVIDVQLSNNMATDVDGIPGLPGPTPTPTTYYLLLPLIRH